jgi:hypothetical protein
MRGSKRRSLPLRDYDTRPIVSRLRFAYSWDPDQIITREAIMECPRCAGLMVQIALIDWEGTYIHYPAQKCVCCGNVVDALIATHRQQAEEAYSR